MTSYAKRVRARYPSARVRRSLDGGYMIEGRDEVTGAMLLLGKGPTPAKAWARAANALEAPIEGIARVVDGGVEPVNPEQGLEHVSGPLSRGLAALLKGES